MKFKMNLKTIPRSKVRRVMLAHRGSISQLAREIGVTPTMVANVLRGRATSAHVLAVATERAAKLESEKRAAKERAA